MCKTVIIKYSDEYYAVRGMHNQLELVNLEQLKDLLTCRYSLKKYYNEISPVLDQSSNAQIIIFTNESHTVL